MYLSESAWISTPKNRKRMDRWKGPLLCVKTAKGWTEVAVNIIPGRSDTEVGIDSYNWTAYRLEELTSRLWILGKNDYNLMIVTIKPEYENIVLVHQTLPYGMTHIHAFKMICDRVKQSKPEDYTAHALECAHYNIDPEDVYDPEAEPFDIEGVA